MAATLGRVAGKEVAARLRWEPDAAVSRLVATWPAALETKRAAAMGLRADSGFEALVRAFMAEENRNG
jgi:hypothetical protein